MTHKIIAIILLFSVLADFHLTPRQQKRLEKSLNKAWHASDIQISPLCIDSTLEIQPDDLYYSISNDEGIIGYAAGRKITDQYLNYFPLFAFDSDLKVKEVFIIEMNTIKGAEITAKSWLKQFKSYSGGQLKLGKDIDGITGATLSGLSMVREVQRFWNNLDQTINSTNILVGQ
ncbi:MAG: hypothetical protein HN936_13335 [Bacteroidetes bacterium]|jgi:hypothetical protein|nr:hypothetical protein [Bacteroidota bacterium]MBT7094224.1 hypothetical protein [Bacteroidota bacterium]MBT7462653.1 hypothetical protein [Bacteroidota bacterium]